MYLDLSKWLIIWNGWNVLFLYNCILFSAKAMYLDLSKWPIIWNGWNVLFFVQLHTFRRYKQPFPASLHVIAFSKLQQRSRDQLVAILLCMCIWRGPDDCCNVLLTRHRTYCHGDESSPIFLCHLNLNDRQASSRRTV